MKELKSNALIVGTNLKLDWCSYKAAKYAVVHWHYSKRMPDPKCVKIGVWENQKFIGVIIFSRGVSSSAIAKSFGLDTTAVVELTRVALTTHISSVTKIISIAIKLLKKKDAGLRLLISYADENQGHVGTIYQAGNWVYTGKSARVSIFKTPHGKIIHDRSCSNSGYKKQFGRIVKVPNRKDLIEIKQLPKWRYLYPLDNEMRKKIEDLADNYPKRGGLGGGQQIPSVESGATPTSPLQK